VILLTPGPLTTRRETREAMLEDWGSRDPAFIALTATLRQGLLRLAHGEERHTAIPIQGSGTFVIEAAIGTLVAPADKLLVLANGRYGERMAAIGARLGRRTDSLHWTEQEPVDPGKLRRQLQEDPGITHVGLVHCETTSGILNPLEEIARVVAEEKRLLIVDAMSSFGALEIDLARLPVAALLASSNKCLEGTPGLAFALIDRAVLAAAGEAASISLDLKAQWRNFEQNGQWRFTPPVQVVAAAVKALALLEEEGGPKARFARYERNLFILKRGMTRLGFELYLEESLQSPIIATFRIPPGWHLSFRQFYDALAARGFLIYPGKLTSDETFRIGCIGAIGESEMEAFLAAAEVILKEQAS
jgi:2-aminoethylphosphonate-pyruvate transaminase